MRRHGWSLGGTVALLALLATSACADGTSDAPASARPSPSPASPTASLTAAQVAERDALAAYRGMWEDWVAVAETSDYESPRMARHASGSALTLAYRAVYTNWQNGVVSKGSPGLNPRITAADPADRPERVTVVDCVDTTHWLNYKPDGSLQDDVPGGRSQSQALVLFRDDAWKVDQLVLQDKGTC